MNHSIVMNDIAILLLLVLVMRRTRRAKPTPAIHIHPCITVSTAFDEAAVKRAIDNIGRGAAE